MEADSDWKASCEKEAGGLVDSLKELCGQEKWVANGNKPCDMFKMEVDNRLATKGIATVAFPFQKVVAFFKDPNVTKKINQSLNNFQIIYTDEAGKFKVVHMEYKGIWPVANRDFVIVSVRHEEENSYYIATKSCNYPKEEVKGIVRAELFVGGYIIERIDEKSTKVTYIANSDPKGNIPGMVKNTLASRQGSVASKIQGVMEKESF